MKSNQVCNLINNIIVTILWLPVEGTNCPPPTQNLDVESDEAAHTKRV